MRTLKQVSIILRFTISNFCALIFRMDTSEENMFVWEGSQVQLRCIVNNTLISDNLGKIAWFKDGRMINKHDPRKRIVFQVRAHK